MTDGANHWLQRVTWAFEKEVAIEVLNADDSLAVHHTRSHDIVGRPVAGAGGWIQVITWVICATLLGAVLVHEVAVARFGRSWLLEKCSSPKALQFTYLMWLCSGLADPTVLIPTSFSLAQELGAGAATSGMLLGSGFVLSPLVCVLGAYIFKARTQSMSRYIAIAGVLLLVFQNLVYATVLDSGLVVGPQALWGLIALRILCGLGRINLVQYMAYKVTPRSQMTDLSILTAAFTNAGLCAGPLISSVMITALGGEGSVPTVQTRGATPVYVLAVLWSFILLAFSLVLPLDLRPWWAEEEEEAILRVSQPGAKLVKMSTRERQQVVILGMVYTAERGFTVSAIEAGTAMLLEVQYKWSGSAIGFGISCVFAETVLVALGLMWLKTSSIVKEVPALLFLSVAAASAAILLFDVQIAHAQQILCADGIIYPFVYTASGIMDGFATKLAMQDSWCSMESYLATKGALQATMRFIAPPTARVLLDATGNIETGRNIYAGVQLSLGILGVLSTIKVAHIMSRLQAAQLRGSEAKAIEPQAFERVVKRKPADQ